jgi:hypothetical protein
MKRLVLAVSLFALLSGTILGFAQELNPQVVLNCGQPLEDTITVGPFDVRGFYKIEVPAEATKLSVVVESLDGKDIDFGANFGRPEYITDGDHVRISEGKKPTLTITEKNTAEDPREPGLKKPGIYYVIIGNPVAPPHKFRLTATWFIGELECANFDKELSRVELKANKPTADSQPNGLGKIKTVAGRSFPEKQYTIDVSAGVRLLAIRVQNEGAGNLDMHIRAAQPVEVSGKFVKADFSLLSPSGTEFLIINNPQPKRYFVVIENRENTDQKFSLIATPISDVQALKSGEPASGEIDPDAGLLPLLRQYLQTTRGQLGLTQYKVVVPDKLKTMTIQLEGPNEKNLDLHLRSAKPIEIGNDGEPISDLSLIGKTANETILLSKTLLKPGEWFLAVESLEKEKQTFRLTVTLDLGDERLTLVFVD